MEDTANTLITLTAWPARMRAAMAAAYVDAPSIQVFRKHVKHGLYPKPYKRAGEEMAWLKVELDAALQCLPTGANDNADDEFE